jgi:hypothetical protein
MPLGLAFLAINYYLSLDGQSLVEYLVVGSYLITATVVLLFYAPGTNRFAEDLHFALRPFLYFSFVSFLAQFVVQGRLTPISLGTTELVTFHKVFFFQPRETIPFILRNQGVFWEPGVLQVYMNLMFFLSVFVLKSKKYAVLSAISILTTVSTMGYVLLLLQVMVWLITASRRSAWWVMAGSVVVIVLGAGAYLNLADKVSGVNKRSASARVYDLKSSLNIVREYPATGIGLSARKHAEQMYLRGIRDTELTMRELKSRGNSNSIAYAAAALGIPMFAALMIALYRQSLIERRRLLVFCVLVACLSSEPLYMTTFFILVAASGLRRRRRSGQWNRVDLPLHEPTGRSAA